MNAPERRMVRLAISLFLIGVVYRTLPWGLPSIESFQVGDSIIVANEASTSISHNIPQKSTDNLTKEEKTPKKRKKSAKNGGSLPVHINTATAEELCALNGIGPKLAEKIIEVRKARGPFKKAADLQKVPGIGKKKLEKMLPGVIFD